MAGDTKEPGADTIIEPDTAEYVDPFPTMLDKLGEIVDGLRGLITNGDELYEFGGNGRMLPTWQKLHVARLVFSTSVAAVVTLTVGTKVYTFTTGTADTKDVPLPITVERGTDLSIAASAGTVTAYLIATAD